MFVNTEIRTGIEIGTVKDEDREIAVQFNGVTATFYLDNQEIGTIDVEHFIEFLNVCMAGVKSLDMLTD